MNTWDLIAVFWMGVLIASVIADISPSNLKQQLQRAKHKGFMQGVHTLGDEVIKMMEKNRLTQCVRDNSEEKSKT